MGALHRALGPKQYHDLPSPPFHLVVRVMVVCVIVVLQWASRCH